MFNIKEQTAEDILEFFAESSKIVMLDAALQKTDFELLNNFFGAIQEKENFDTMIDILSKHPDNYSKIEEIRNLYNKNQLKELHSICLLLEKAKTLGQGGLVQ